MVPTTSMMIKTYWLKGRCLDVTRELHRNKEFLELMNEPPFIYGVRERYYPVNRTGISPF